MMQKIFRSVLAVACLGLTAGTALAGEVKVTLNQGLVTIIAEDAPISRILAEWARVGQTKIVNGEKMMQVVSLQLVDMPERKALDIILRSASGYMAAERQTPVAGGSAFDRIMILPYSRPPAASSLPATGSAPAPFQQQQPRPMQIDPDDQPHTTPVMPPGMGPGPNAGQQTAPMPGMLTNGPPNQNPNPNANPNSPPQQQTLPRPGFLPAPGPQQPVPFGAPAAPGKPPGGGGGGQI